MVTGRLRAWSSVWLVVLALGLALGVSAVTPETVEADEPDVLVDLYFYWSNSVRTEDPCISGYDWDPTDTNMGLIREEGADYIYLCAKYVPFSSAASPITEVAVTSEDHGGNHCASGWSRARGDDGSPKDLNDDNGGNYIYLCYTSGGLYPLLGLQIVPSVLGIWACPSGGYVGINQSLNEGTQGAANYVCYASTRTAEYIFDCGGEGESLCGFGTKFWWENGGGGCDRGLRDDEGTCVNDTRRQGAAEAFQSTWTYWALLNQVNDLALDVPLGEYTMVGAHNSFNNMADGYLIPNQRYSITDQLRAGLRVIDLDIHAGTNGAELVTGTLPELCHGGEFHGGCVIGDRLFSSALKEIRNWMLRPENLDQTIVILLEDYVYRDDFEVTYAIQARLDVPGIGVYDRANLSATSTPTRGEMLAANQRVFILAQNDFYGDIAFKKTGIEKSPPHPQLTSRSGGIPVEDFIGYPTCNVPDDPDPPLFQSPGASYLITEINGDRIAGGAEPIERSDLETLSRCAIDIVNVDFVLDASEAPDGERLRGAIWSWTEDHRGSGDAAIMLGDTGRWWSNDALFVPRPYACRINGGAWRVSAASGPWADGWDVCQAEFGQWASFAVPTNGWLNQQLREANSGNQDIWLNYNDLRVEGQWLINNRPTIEMTGPANVNEGTDEVLFTFTITDDPGDSFVLGTPDCGVAGSFVAGSLVQSGSGGSFKCVFPAGGDGVADATATTVTPTVTDGVGVKDHRAGVASLSAVTVNVVNVSPVISSFTANVTAIDENGAITVEGTFVDPGADVHEVRIDWGNGESEVVSLALGVRSFSAFHQYLDDSPTATASDVYAVSVVVADERGPSAAVVENVTVSNVAPVVQLDAAVDELGNAVGVDIDVALVGLELTIGGGFTDVGTLDTHSIELDWGDGSTVESGSLTSAHRYTGPGVFEPTLTVTDDDTGIGSGLSQVTVVTPLEAIGLTVEHLLTLAPSEPAAERAVERAITRLQGSRGGAGGGGAADFVDAGLPGAAIEMLQRATEYLVEAEAVEPGLDLGVWKDVLALSSKSIALEALSEAVAAGSVDARRLGTAAELIVEGDSYLQDGPDAPYHVDAIDRFGLAAALFQGTVVRGGR